MISAAIFDFDGVIAEPGFRLALAEFSANSPDANSPDKLTEIAAHGMRALLKSGYVTGTGSEEEFWTLLSAATPVRGDRASLREAIIRRSTPRRQMLGLVGGLRNQGLPIALLSDHTDWLDNIAAATGLADHFDYFFNSYYLQRCKRDPQLFDQVLEWMGCAAAQTLFVDDNPANVERAVSRGLQGIVYQSFPQLQRDLTGLGLAIAESVG